MSQTQLEPSFKEHAVSAQLSSLLPETDTREGTEGRLYDISVCSSVIICRICHCSNEDEELIQPCRCSGSVGYAHQSCIRKWIVGSTNSACELCNYSFKTETKRILDIRKLRFPRPSFKGWLHIFLCLALFSIMLTSLSWIMWSQLSTSEAAERERESNEITYAYAVNGGFMIMALIGLYLDSFRQCRAYYKKWSMLNYHLIIFPYDANADEDYRNKTAGFLFSSQHIKANTSPAFHGSETCVASTPNTSGNKSVNTHARDTTSLFSYENEGFAQNIRIIENQINTHAININHSSTMESMTHHHEWPLVASSYMVHPSSVCDERSLHQSRSEPADLRNIVIVKETYV